MIADRVVARPGADTWQDVDDQGRTVRAHHGHRRASAGRPSTTRRTTSSRSCSPRWAPSRSRTRRVFDTPPPSPVWGPASVAAAPPTSSRTCPTLTASSSRARTWPSAHPVGFQWVMEAKARGAKVIHVDPRFTRTSAVADTARAAAGRAATSPSSAAIINYILQQRARTSATTSSPTPTRRRSSARTSATPRTSTGCSPASTRRRAPTTRPRWQYEGQEEHAAAGMREGAGQDGDGTRSEGEEPAQRRAAGTRRAATARRWSRPRHRDETLQHPRCVYQVLKRHYARYTPEMVRADLRHPAGDVPRGVRGRGPPTPAASGPPRWSTASAGPSTAVGVQYIRSRRDPPAAAGQHGPSRRRDPGAARSRQHPGLDRHPDAVQPAAGLPADAQRAASTTRCRTTSTASAAPARRASGATPDAYAVSLLKAYWGDAATAGERLLLRLPAADRPATTAPTRPCMDMLDGKVKGYFLLGQNPAVGSANGRLQRLGMANLDWLVVRDLLVIETRDLLEGRAGDRDRRDRAPRTSAPRCSSCPRPRTWRRTARSPRPSGCCSGTTRRSSRPATAAASCGSSTTSAA